MADHGPAAVARDREVGQHAAGTFRGFDDDAAHPPILPHHPGDLVLGEQGEGGFGGGGLGEQAEQIPLRDHGNVGVAHGQAREVDHAHGWAAGDGQVHVGDLGVRDGVEALE